MKNFDVLHIRLLFLLILAFQSADAQDYVITNRGDSLTGEVRPVFFGTQQKVQVVGPGKEKTTFSLFDVRAFSSDGDLYHPVKGEKGYVFMKLVQPGYLSLYAFQQENLSRFDGLFFKKADGANLIVPNLGFKKYVSQFLEDCPLVVQRIKEGELGKKNLTEIVQAYNACVDGRTIDHGKIIAQRGEQNTSLSAWDSLEEKVKAAEFSEKNNALEMIAEVRNKILQQEKIPNFLLEGLRNSLQNTDLTADLELAMKEVQQ